MFRAGGWRMLVFFQIQKNGSAKPAFCNHRGIRIQRCPWFQSVTWHFAVVGTRAELPTLPATSIV